MRKTRKKNNPKIDNDIQTLGPYLGWGKEEQWTQRRRKKLKQPFEGTKYELPPNDYQMGN